MADYNSSLPVKTNPGVVLSEDLKSLNGTAISVNSGNKDNGTQRVVIASDQPAVPVSFTPASTPAAIVDYNTAASVAAAASSNHTFTPSSYPFNLESIIVSAGGQMKAEIQVGPTGSEVTKAVLFTSKGHLTEKISLAHPLVLTSGQSIKIIRTNTDDASMDVYSTIQGY